MSLPELGKRIDALRSQTVPVTKKSLKKLGKKNLIKTMISFLRNPLENLGKINMMDLSIHGLTTM